MTLDQRHQYSHFLKNAFSYSLDELQAMLRLAKKNKDTDMRNYVKREIKRRK